MAAVFGILGFLAVLGWICSRPVPPSEFDRDIFVPHDAAETERRLKAAQATFRRSVLGEPPRREGAAAGRFSKLCLWIGLPTMAFAVWRWSHGVDGGDPSSSLLIGAFAICFIGPALLTIAAVWIRTGRIG